MKNPGTEEMLQSFRIRYTIVIVLIIIFTWWGIKAFERFLSQPLATDISYNFGDNDEYGIQFPLITFCEYMTGRANQLLKMCNNGSWDFFPSLQNCLKKDKKFQSINLV